MRIVLDTNVLVSGLLTPHGTCARVVDLCLSNVFHLCVSDRITAEYAEVLQRPELRIEQPDAGELLAYIRGSGLFVSAVPLQADLPDPDDLPFLEVARAAAAVLVAGKPRHFPPGCRAGVDVVTPGEVLERYAQGR